MGFCGYRAVICARMRLAQEFAKASRPDPSSGLGNGRYFDLALAALGKPRKVLQRFKRIHSIRIRHTLQIMPLNQPFHRNFELLPSLSVGNSRDRDDVIGHMPR